MWSFDLNTLLPGGLSNAYRLCVLRKRIKNISGNVTVYWKHFVRPMPGPSLADIKKRRVLITWLSRGCYVEDNLDDIREIGNAWLTIMNEKSAVVVSRDFDQVWSPWSLAKLHRDSSDKSDSKVRSINADRFYWINKCTSWCHAKRDVKYQNVINFAVFPSDRARRILDIFYLSIARKRLFVFFFFFFFFFHQSSVRTVDWPISWIFPVQVRANIAKNRSRNNFRARSARYVSKARIDRAIRTTSVALSWDACHARFDEVDIKNNLSRQPDTVLSKHRLVSSYKSLEQKRSLVAKKSSICSPFFFLFLSRSFPFLIANRIDRQTIKDRYFLRVNFHTSLSYVSLMKI